MKRVRTRFAPSPTGPLHLGGLRTALYAYLFAKKNGGDFILRIEDTDVARTVPGSETVINESLNWCELFPDESVERGGPHAPYRQSERKDIYRKYALELVNKGKAYYAFDTEEEIAKWRQKTTEENNGVADAYNHTTRLFMRNSLSLSKQEVEELIQSNTPYVIRFKVDASDNVHFNDKIRGDVSFMSSQLDDRVLLKSDGMPTYHLANVVDDHLMEITHVIRGEEWLASTPHHILMYQAFGWDYPEFSHLPLILKPDGKGKLSKRDGDRLGFPVFCTQFINPEDGHISLGYREKGFEKEAFVNFIAMLGWNDGTDRELFTLKELIDNFSIERVHKSGARFDYNKAIWFNQQYVRSLSIEDLAQSCQEQIRQINPEITDAWLQSYCSLYRERIDFRFQLTEVGKYLYTDIENFDTETFNKKWKPELALFFDLYIQLIQRTDFGNATLLEEETKSIILKNSLSLGNVLPILRIGLTGTTKGPAIFDSMILLGKEKTLERLERLKTFTA